MSVPDDLIPYCPNCKEPMSMNLRADHTFVQDEGGYNTPGIIKYPFWQMTAENPKAIYACINYGEADCPKEIEAQSVCIDGDIGMFLEN